MRCDNRRFPWLGLVTAGLLALGTVACQKGQKKGEGASPSSTMGGEPMARVRADPGASRPGVTPRRSRPRPARRAVDPDPPASVLSKDAQLPPDALAQLARKGVLSFPSQWNGKVHVKQKGRVRSLYLGKRLDIVHTRLNLDRPADLISPYQQCLLLGLGLFQKPRTEVKRVAMIGLGGGAITRFFHLKWPTLVFHSVEIDPMVVAVARRFFGVKDTPTYRSYAVDGRKFIREAKRPYDVIIMDAFDAAATLPKQLASQEFFKLLRSRLTPRGVLVMNFLVHSRRIYASVLKTLKTVFPRVQRLPLRRFKSHNVLLLAPADPKHLPERSTLKKRLSNLKSLFSVEFPLERCLETLDSDQVDLKNAAVIHDPK